MTEKPVAYQTRKPSRKRKVMSATIPEALLREVVETYGNVSEFTERALRTQMQLDSQQRGIEAAWDFDYEAMAAARGTAEYKQAYAQAGKELQRARAEIVRLRSRRGGA